MSPELRVLAWLHARRLRGGLLGIPLALAAVTWILGFVPTGAPPAELLLVALVPFAAAAIGAAVPGFDDERQALPWLLARAVPARRLLLSGLAGQLLVLAACSLTAAGLVHALAPDRQAFTRFGPGEGRVTVDALGRWAETLDAGFGLLVALSVLLAGAAFLWGLGLGAMGQSATTSLLGATLLSWLQAALLVVPGTLLAGSIAEPLGAWPALAPGFLLPPLLLAAWAGHRWDPQAPRWPRRRLVTLLAASAVLVLASWALSLPRVVEARELVAIDVVAGVPAVESSRLARHPHEQALVARELHLRGGATRVVLEDAEALRSVLPRGTTLVGWMQPLQANSADWRLVVEWPGGLRRELRPNGTTARAIPQELCDAIVRPEPAR